MNRNEVGILPAGRKTPLNSDWLNNQVSGPAMSSARSLRSLAVIPSGPGLLDGSRFDNTFWTSVTKRVPTDNSFLVGQEVEVQYQVGALKMVKGWFWQECV